LLLVEDEQLMINLYKRAFEQQNFEVEVAKNGKEGILKAAKWQPDIILLDIRMPDMDGITALRHLKELPQTSRVPVVLLSALSEEIHSKEDVKGAAAYIEKGDSSLKKVVEKVREVLLKEG